MQEDLLQLHSLADYDYDARFTSRLQLATLCCKVLIEHGADPAFQDRWGATPMDEAKGNREVIEALSLREAAPDEEASDVSTTLPLLAEQNKGSAAKVRPTGSLRKSGASCSIAARELCAAARIGDIEEVNRLIKKGSSGRETTMGEALSTSRAAKGTKTARMLVDIYGATLGREDAVGRTPLLEAYISGHGLVVSALLQRGASLTEEQKHRLGIVYCACAHKDDRETLRRLTDSGGDVNMADYDERTALHIACAEGIASLVSWLLLRGASNACLDRFGNNPREDAKKHGHAHIVKILDDYETGATINV